MNRSYQDCIDQCNACAVACDHCAVACLDEQDVRSMAACIRLDMDCAQICRLAAAYMSRDSTFASMLCKICAEVCERCAKECERHSAEHCQRCAEACRNCADACRQMA